MKKARRPNGFWAGKPCPDYNDPAYSHLPNDKFFQEYQAWSHAQRRRRGKAGAMSPQRLKILSTLMYASVAVGSGVPPDLHGAPPFQGYAAKLSAGRCAHLKKSAM